MALFEKLKAERQGKQVQFEEMEVEEEEEEEEEEEDDDSEEEEEDNNEALDYVFNPDVLLPSGRGTKLTKIDRIKSILSGRNEKKFESTHRGGLTNKEKTRKKNYMMIRKGKNEVSNKNRRSSSEVRTRNAKRVSNYLFIEYWIYYTYYTFLFVCLFIIERTIW
jgi:hypothetical protein